MNNEDRYYRTSSFNIATFLFAKGCELVNIDRLSHEKRATFVFINSPEIEQLVYDFSFGKEDKENLMVDVRKIVYAIKQVKEKLYQNNY